MAAIPKTLEQKHDDGEAAAYSTLIICYDSGRVKPGYCYTPFNQVFLFITICNRKSPTTTRWPVAFSIIQGFTFETNCYCGGGISFCAPKPPRFKVTRIIGSRPVTRSHWEVHLYSIGVRAQRGLVRQTRQQYQRLGDNRCV